MQDREQRLITSKAHQVIWFIVGLIVALLALRFTLKLIAANPGNAFADFIYGLSGVFLWPFFGLTITPNVGGVVLEFHTIIAMFVYTLLGWAAQKAIEVVFYRPAELAPVETRLVERVETVSAPHAHVQAPASAPHAHPHAPAEQRRVPDGNS